MKTRVLLIAAICVIAGAAIWYRYQTPTDNAAKPAGTMAVPAPSQPAPVAAAPAVVTSAVPPQVAKPVVKAAAMASSGVTVPADQAETFVAGPKSDLKSCVSATIHFLESQDITSLVQTIMPPDAIKRMIDSGQATSIEDIAEHYREIPGIDSKMEQLLQGLKSAQDQAPTMNDDGAQATYKIDSAVTGPGKPDAPAGTPGNITFIKIDGNWYLR